MAIPLPCSIIKVIQTLEWPLNGESLSPMRLESLERLAEIRSPALPSGEDVLSTVALLRNSAVGNDKNDSLEYWARIATALLLLGHGYCDEAHNLVGPLSFPNALPYYHGPPVASPPDILAAASHAHCLVHRREGPHASEFGMTGHDNSNFWAGATLRSGGEETLPLMEIQRKVARLAQQTSIEAQQWLEQNVVTTCCGEWNPRPLTELCATVLTQEMDITNHHHHVLHDFCQQAALVELRVLLQHTLAKLGYDTTIFNQDEQGPSTTLIDTSHSQCLLPRTLDQALSLENHALVVTSATSPHTIQYVNQAWIDLCGYTYPQAVGNTFGKLIQGPDTNTIEAAAMVRKCRETLQPQEAYLINYTAAGERFLNHVTIGPLQNQSGEQADFLVGILERVPLRVAASS